MSFLPDFFSTKRKIARQIFFLATDGAAIAVAVFLAFMVRFEGAVPNHYLLNIWGMIFLSLAVTLPLFHFFKLYQFTWSYVSATELIALIKAVASSFLIIVLLFFVLREHPIFTGFPRSTLFISFFFIFILSGATRFSKRIYLEITRHARIETRERTLIVGAGDAGEQILRSILSSKSGPYLPVGFIDDHPAKEGILIHGQKVLGKIREIPKIVKENKIEGLIIALPSAGSLAIRAAVEQGRAAGLQKIKVVPPIDEVINGELSVRSLREVQVEDLLGREPVSLDQEAIGNFIKNKKVLITGGAGSIGSELCLQVAKFDPLEILILDQDETGVFNISEELKDKFPKLKIWEIVADVSDNKRIDKIFEEFSPQIVFHAAAYKHVPLMEENFQEAVKNNIFGTKSVAESALEHGVEKFVFISTDKAINPTSIMGATKRIGEMICLMLNGRQTKFVAVRFGNVLDSRGSVIPIFREQIKKGGPVEITHPDMKRYFMVTSEACLLVMQAAAMGQGGEVFVLDMGKPIKILDLAKEMIRLSGLKPDSDIPIVFTKPRPGEKFFEEILSAEEGTLATQNQKIFIAKLSKINLGKLASGLERLKKIMEDTDKRMIIKVLKEIIPTYHG